MQSGETLIHTTTLIVIGLPTTLTFMLFWVLVWSLGFDSDCLSNYLLAWVCVIVSQLRWNNVLKWSKMRNVWVTMTKPTTENVGKSSQSWWNNTIAIHCWCDSSQHLRVMLQHTVWTLQPRASLIPAPLHHIIAQHRHAKEVNMGPVGTAAGTDTLTWLKSPQWQCKGKSWHKGHWPPPWAQSNSISNPMKTLTCLLFVLCCPSYLQQLFMTSFILRRFILWTSY